jgi:hypothetical protein
VKPPAPAETVKGADKKRSSGGLLGNVIKERYADFPVNRGKVGPYPLYRLREQVWADLKDHDLLQAKEAARVLGYRDPKSWFERFSGENKYPMPPVPCGIKTVETGGVRGRGGFLYKAAWVWLRSEVEEYAKRNKPKFLVGDDRKRKVVK